MTDFFEGDTTSFSDDFTGTVVGFDPEEGTFGPQIKVTVKYDEPQPKNDGTLATEKFFWLPIPDSFRFNGERLVATDGDLDKRMNAKSKLQRVIQAAGEGGARNFLTRDGLTPYHPAAWIGLKAHWMTIGANEDYNVKDKDTGGNKKGKTAGFPAPVEYLGTDATGNGAAKATLDLASLQIPDSVLDVWMKLADTETADSFVSAAASQVPELPAETRSQTVAALSDGSLYDSLQAF